MSLWYTGHDGGLMEVKGKVESILYFDYVEQRVDKILVCFKVM